MKRLYSSLLVLALLFTCVLPAVSAQAVWQCPFNDVPQNAWYRENLEHLEPYELFNGTSENTFSPKGQVNHAMLVTLLWRYAGCPEPRGGEIQLEYVNPNGYYYKAAMWALENRIIPRRPVMGSTLEDDELSENESGNGLRCIFIPNMRQTREDVLVAVYNTARFLEADMSPSSDLKEFADRDQIEVGYEKFYQWAVAVDILRGELQNNALVLNPKGNVTRAQMASFLDRMIVFLEK